MEPTISLATISKKKEASTYCVAYHLFGSKKTKRRRHPHIMEPIISSDETTINKKEEALPSRKERGKSSDVTQLGAALHTLR
eukprot:2692390-Ditylum_brightwellii.AAC.1